MPTWLIRRSNLQVNPNSEFNYFNVFFMAELIVTAFVKVNDWELILNPGPLPRRSDKSSNTPRSATEFINIDKHSFSQPIGSNGSKMFPKSKFLTSIHKLAMINTRTEHDIFKGFQRFNTYAVRSWIILIWSFPQGIESFPHELIRWFKIPDT
jgi:hypothetical protein